MIEVRAAHRGDLARIVRWNQSLAAESEAKSLDAVILEQGVARLLDDAGLGRYFIAELDGDPAGQLMLTREWSDWRNGLFWWIQSVYVEPPCRGRGVFRALYRHVEALGRAEPDVCGLRLYVHEDNTGAADVYLRLGMQEERYRVMEALFRRG